MSREEPVPIVGVGDQLRDEIQSGEFDRFVIFTYGLTPEYLQWFDDSDLVAICGPDETVETARTAEQAPVLSAFNRETHAKVYLLYNESRMVAYLGSFNFTRGGLYESVEWGARYEGQIDTSPDPETLVNGDAPTEISTSPIIEQILTIVGASMNGADTDVADSWVTNTALGEGVVHTLRSNTLQTVFTELLEDVEGTIEIDYYSPFVTYRGVTEFTSFLPSSLPDEALDFSIYTKRLDRIGDTEEMLSPEAIEDFDDRFGSFRVRARAPGDQGNQLPDGRELRSGMAHLKTIALTVQEDGERRPLGVILTSANLSKRAWNTRSPGFEIGVALTDGRYSQQLHSFFTKELPQCYVDPSERALANTSATTAARSWGTEEWLTERVRSRVSLATDSITIDWDSSLPTLEDIEASVYFRDTKTGERFEHTAPFDATPDGYKATFPDVTAERNQLIDFIRIVATSQQASPELVYSGREIPELRADLGIEGDPETLPDRWLDFDELVWNNAIEKLVTDASFDDVDTVTSVRLRSYYDSPKPYRVTYEPESQPHLADVITDITVSERTVSPFDTLICVEIEQDPTVAVDVDDLIFYSQDDRRVNPLGFAVGDDSIEYYFPLGVLGDLATVRLQGLVSRYIRETEREIALDGVTTSGSFELSKYLPTSNWQATPVDANPVLKKPKYDLPPQFRTEDSDTVTDIDISEEMAVEISPPEELLAEYERNELLVWWRPSGPFRSGHLQPIDEPIPPQEPRTRVNYRGVLNAGETEQEIYIWLPGGNYLVHEQPFVETIDVSLRAIPANQNFKEARRSSLLGWIVIRQEDLLNLRASDVAYYLDVRLYVDGEPVPGDGFGITQSGGLLCIPVLWEHIGSTRELTLRLWISDGPAKTNHYSEAARSLQLSVTRVTDDTITIEVGDQTRQVNDSSTGDLPSLEPFASSINRGELENQTRSLPDDETFSVQSYTPLRIIPNEMTLFQFTDR